jgi:phenylacetate-CoA ligase
MRSFGHKTHELLSTDFLLPLGRLQRFARPSRRAVIRAYYRGMAFRRQAMEWDFDSKLQWIRNRLQFTVRQAYRTTEYYRKLFDQIGFEPEADFGWDEFARLPVLERDDVRDARFSLLSKGIPFNELLKDSTGGSTGAPTEIFLGPEERGWKESAGDFFMRRIGAPCGARTGLLWGHHLDPKASDSLRDRFHAFESNSRYFDCLRLSPSVLESYHYELQRWQPACIIAYASALGHLAEFVLERGYRANYPSRCMVTGAEKLSPTHRQAIETAFRRPVHERYGGRDVGYVAFQMHPQHTLLFEVDWANVLIEPETSEKESSILVTKLHADGMPMIRYRVGDVARFLPGSKPGHPAFLLNEVVGRDVDRIWLPDGRWITGLQIPHLMKDYPVREYMFFQKSDYSVEIRIAPKSGFTGDAKEKILETVQANLPGLCITTLLVDEVPRTKANKWRPVVSEVDRSRGGAA